MASIYETYCNFVDQSKIDWQNQAPFFGIAGRAMRQILIDHPKRKGREERGGGWARTMFADELSVTQGSEIDILELYEALDKLAELHERMARAVELGMFVGLKVNEAAHVLGVSERTIYDDWRVARMWLRRKLLGVEESQSMG
jgi:RNA polymerase sigma factor (TIGR02999 family)